MAAFLIPAARGRFSSALAEVERSVPFVWLLILSTASATSNTTTATFEIAIILALLQI